MSTSDDISQCWADLRKFEYLKIRAALRGYVVPMRGKKPDAKMSLRQRGTTAWKDDDNSWYNHPAIREEVEEWAAAGVPGIAGIVGERSGIMVLEIDCLEPFLSLLESLNLPLFCTPTATSPSGGKHLHFKYREGFQKPSISIKCPVFNDSDSPCYVGRHELGSLRVNGVLVIAPPGPGRKWEPGFSMVRGVFESQIETVEMPDALFEFLKRFEENPVQYPSREVQSELNPSPHPPTEQDPCSIEQCSPRTGRQTTLLEDDSFVLGYVKDKDSPLIPALVKKLGGKGLQVPCPYDPPDNNPSANFRYHDKNRSRGWYFVDHHCMRGDPAYNIPVSQLCTDLQTGYIERCANGERGHRHLVYTLRKMKVEAFLWVALEADDLGLVNLPPSRFPLRLDGFSVEGERVVRFIDRWERARRCVGNNDPIPLARPWLISILFALPNPGSDGDKPKPAEWLAAYNEVDKALYRAQRQGILEKVSPGTGGKPTLYRLCDQRGD